MTFIVSALQKPSARNAVERMMRTSGEALNGADFTHIFLYIYIRERRASARYNRKSPLISEPDGKLMVIVIADTSTLMIYEGTTLKWSAQLPFAPVAVARAHLQVRRSPPPLSLSLSKPL